jgi:hypothetical protein
MLEQSIDSVTLVTALREAPGEQAATEERRAA